MKIIEELSQILNNPIFKSVVIYNSPFKSLYQTKRISMDGKVIKNAVNNEYN